ncbi:MAG: hypothetical protein AAF089_02300 [Bacteroidota bacterium]
MIQLQRFVELFAGGLKAADSLGPVGSSRTRTYKPGIGPLSEDATVAKVVKQLRGTEDHRDLHDAAPRRYPGSRKACDLVIAEQWAMEFKLLRPFGDNGREAEHWAKNILYPYPGNTGAIGDCLKLLESDFPERKAVVVFGYEHSPAEIKLEPAVSSFELIAENVVGIDLGSRCEAHVTGLVHPYHQQASVFAWEVLGFKARV